MGERLFLTQNAKGRQFPLHMNDIDKKERIVQHLPMHCDNRACHGEARLGSDSTCNAEGTLKTRATRLVQTAKVPMPQGSLHF